MNNNHIHLPDWFANNSLFRKLFLIRKLFLTKVSFKHYGQMAEDQQEATYQLLISKNYAFVNWVDLTLIFKPPAFP